MIVRCHYADGTSQDHELINGKHIVTYEEGNDVPESKLAVKANGKQIRYLKVPCDASKELTRIELVKGDDFSMPLVFALTVESADDNEQETAPNEADVSLQDVFRDAFFMGAAGDVPGRYSDEELNAGKDSLQLLDSGKLYEAGSDSSATACRRHVYDTAHPTRPCAVGPLNGR